MTATQSAFDFASGADAGAADPRAVDRLLAAWLAGYRPQGGLHDELLDARGVPRAYWLRFLRALAALGLAELPRRFEAAERYLREAGVFHRVYGSGAGASVERPWPLAHLPLLIDEREWTPLTAGLVQRAELLERLLADCYGAQRLVREGRIPAAVVAGNPEFLRPMVGARPRGGHFLWLYAADLGRGPDGRWWVLGDRAQAPSGMGYALENRMATVRAFSDLARQLDVHRLGGFFQAFRGALAGLSSADGARVGVLTPGPLNETYFEHAYLARYLGFLLLEGGDLAVRGDRVVVRTVAGPQPIDVLWRRLDAGYADPLELNPHSQIGVPGLLRAAREGNVAIANALGAGLVEAPAWMGFLPALARVLLGEELKLPNVATWWCGDPQARAQALERFDDRLITPAFGPDAQGGAQLVSALDPDRRDALRAAVQARGLDYVAQEVVHLSTMPVWREDRLQPRPCTVRVYLARTHDGWQVLPGAFCRVSEDRDARAVSLQAGGRSADVWVLSRGAPERTSLLPGPDTAIVRRPAGTLPTRAADNLFWLGRYVERAEALLRLLRGYALRAADLPAARDPVQLAVVAELVAVGALAPVGVPPEATATIATALLGLSSSQPGAARAPGALVELVRAARQAAMQVRDRLSPDAWMALHDLESLIGRAGARLLTEGELIDEIGRGLRSVAAFNGLVTESLNRLTGWRFFDIGRRIERGLTLCAFLRRFTVFESPREMPDGMLDALLEFTDSAVTFRQRYSIAAAQAPVVDLVALDANNPRALAFQCARIADQLHLLPGPREPGSPLEALGERLDARTRDARPAVVDAAWLDAVAADLRAMSDALTRQYFSDRGLGRGVRDRGEPGASS
jgi:uncharacterized circularly permuted ATP-grasp superfamily protein/uncharacterized alpha-E superfamily protein